MQKTSLLNLYLIFVKIGAILLGGGYVILPIVTSEFVDKRQFLTNDEVVDFFALSQTLPGIIAANISMFIGYKLRGFWGAVSAMFGIITVPFFAILLLASFLEIISGNLYVQSAFWGVGIAVISLIMLTVREIWQKADKNNFFYIIFALSLIALLYFKLSPVKTILLILFVGVFYRFLTTPKEVR